MNEKKLQKKSGLIRWSALIPFTIITAIVISYFVLFFDWQLKTLLQWAGRKATGVEVNIGSLKTSFTQLNIVIQKIEITDRENPDLNKFEIGLVKFDLSGDALLRLKFVIEEMAVEQIQFLSKRAHRGHVDPIEVAKPETTDDQSDSLHLTDKIKDQSQQVASQVEKSQNNNIIGTMAGFLKADNKQNQFDQIKDELKSKKLAEELQKKWKDKQASWDEQIKKLPKDKELQDLKNQFNAVKSSSFKTPQEVEASVKQFNALKSQVEDKYKTIQEVQDLFNEDLKNIKADSQRLDQQIKEDTAFIKNKLQIPDLNAEQITKALLADYLKPYLVQVDHYKSLYQKYKPKKKDKIDDSIHPHPREKGIVYEFPKTKGYPLFWIKKIKISSRSTSNADYGDIDGEILNIVSNQKQIAKPTEAHIHGDFQSKNVKGINFNAFYNSLKPKELIDMNFSVASLPFPEKDLVQSEDGNIKLDPSLASLKMSLAIEDFEDFVINFNQNFNNVKFLTSAKDKTIDEIFKSTFAQIQSFDLTAKAQGNFNNFDLNVNSTLGEKIEQALKATVQERLNQVNKDIEKYIQGQIGGSQSGLNQQSDHLSSKYLGSTQQSAQQLDGQKKLADDKIAQAKKDFENKLKSQLNQQGQKTLDDLKKKFGF